MKHTLESLLALAATDEGKQQIRVMVAEIQGWQMIKGERPSSLGHLVATIGGKMDFVPFFTTSLDAMAEVLKDKDDAFMREFQHHSLETYRPEFNNLGIDAPRRHSFQSYAIFRALKPDAWRWAVAFILASGQEERA